MTSTNADSPLRPGHVQSDRPNTLRRPPTPALRVGALILLGIMPAHSLALSCAEFNAEWIAARSERISVVRFTALTGPQPGIVHMQFQTLQTLKGAAFYPEEVVFEIKDSIWQTPTPIGEVYLLAGYPNPAWEVCSGVNRYTRCKAYHVKKAVDPESQPDLRCEAGAAMLSAARWASAGIHSVTRQLTQTWQTWRRGSDKLTQPLAADQQPQERVKGRPEHQPAAESR